MANLPPLPGTARRALWAVLVVWIALVLYGTLVPVTTQKPPLFANADKVMHFGAWAGIGLWAGLLWSSRRARVVVFVAGSAFGLAVELGQELVVGRGFEWLDLLADSVGAGLGALLAGVAVRWLDRSRTR